MNCTRGVKECSGRRSADEDGEQIKPARQASAPARRRWREGDIEGQPPVLDEGFLYCSGQQSPLPSSSPSMPASSSQRVYSSCSHSRLSPLPPRLPLIPFFVSLQPLPFCSEPPSPPSHTHTHTSHVSVGRDCLQLAAHG